MLVNAVATAPVLYRVAAGVEGNRYASAFHLSLGISYPNIEDTKRGLNAGLITRAQRDAIVKAIKAEARSASITALGGLIYIHGNVAEQRLDMGPRGVGECKH